MGEINLRKRAVYFGVLLGLIGFTGCVGCPTRGPIQYASDTYTTQQVKSALKTRYPNIKSEVMVKTFDKVVSLSGTVNTVEDKQKILAVAQGVTGVRVVLDYMKVRIPTGAQKS